VMLAHHLYLAGLTTVSSSSAQQSQTQMTVLSHQCLELDYTEHFIIVTHKWCWFDQQMLDQWTQ